MKKQQKQINTLRIAVVIFLLVTIVSSFNLKSKIKELKDVDHTAMLSIIEIDQDIKHHVEYGHEELVTDNDAGFLILKYKAVAVEVIDSCTSYHDENKAYHQIPVIYYEYYAKEVAFDNVTVSVNDDQTECIRTEYKTVEL